MVVAPRVVASKNFLLDIPLDMCIVYNLQGEVISSLCGLYFPLLIKGNEMLHDACEELSTNDQDVIKKIEEFINS